MSVLDEILKWSGTLDSPWVRDALRRIVAQSEISEVDIVELTELCKKAQGLSATDAEALPLQASDLPTASESGTVSLVSLTHVSDVNALAPNETIRFGKTGLTVVYGDNGAGKSGYGRIMKRACRARGSGDAILANALSDKAAGPPTAKFTVDVGGAEREYLWKDGTPGPSDLGAVSVFDSSAAQVYVSNKTEVRFRPFGLDVLDQLAGVCARVKDRLDGERRLLELQGPTWPMLPPGTEAARIVSGLTALTKLDTVDRAVVLTKEERQELENLTAVVATAKSENPAKKASDLEVKARRLRRLVEEIDGLSLLLGEKAVAEFAALRDSASVASKAARVAAERFNGQVSLAGLESHEWRNLWESARSYSEGKAYPGHAFPHVLKDAKCVLCQQDLDKSARERLSALEDFVCGAAQSEAAAKQKSFDASLQRYRAISPGKSNEDALDDLAVLDPEVSKSVVAFLGDATAARTGLVGGGSALMSAQSPVASLETLAKGLDTRAAGIAKAANPAQLKLAEERLVELKARATLEEVLPQVHAEIDRLGRINAYGQCVKTTETRTLTKLSTDLTTRYVTNALVASFDDELRRLKFVSPELELKAAGGSRGVLYHQVFLKHSTKAQLANIVSEGENRCIALAAFLAEVQGASHPSAIVFDDPVSSLDHRWRSQVTKRLVDEAKVRQVIVFTHEVVFLNGLVEEAKKSGVPCSTQTVRRGPDQTAGLVEAELPWVGKGVKDRIKVLRQDWEEANRVYSEQGEEAYEPKAFSLYARLRQTWERAVEEVLFNETVVRFRPGIETKRMAKLGDITKEDIEAVDIGMTKTSKWEGGHDHALAAHEPVPSPTDLKTDIDQLDDWVTAVKNRRK